MNKATTTQGKQQRPKINSYILAQVSKQHTKDLGTFNLTDGGATTITLPQNGLMHTLYLTFQISLTIAGTVSSGIWNARPAVPFAAINSLQVTNNANLYIRNISGWGNYLWNRASGIILPQDPFNTGSSEGFASNNGVALGYSGSSRPVAGANIAAGTFNFNMTVPIQFPLNMAGDDGLIVLQQSQSYWYLIINMANLISPLSATGGTSAIINTLVGTGLSYTLSATVSVGLLYWDIVRPDYFDYSDLLGNYTQINEQFMTPVNGVNVIQPPRNDTYVAFINEVTNNGAAVAVSTLSQLQLTYAGAIVGYSDQYLSLLNKYFYDHHAAPVDGTWMYDWRYARGLPGKADKLLGINNQKITDLNMNFTLATGGSLTNPSARTVMVSVRPISQQIQALSS